MTNKLLVALYVRVSKIDQVNLNQLLELRKYCEFNNFEIYKEYVEQGISGSKTSRPQLDLMLQEMRQRKFNGVVVWKIDRLGRSTKHLLQVAEEMKNLGIRLISTSQSIDTETAMGKFFFTILSAVGELEREVLIERTLLGLERAKKQGKLLGRRKGAKDKSKRCNLGYINRYKSLSTTS